MVTVYNIFIQLYLAGVRIASLWNKKAKEWIEGRRNLFEELESKISPDDKIIWFHCASAGEFEQAKPIIEEIKKEYAQHKILVSFFSPSGFNAAKKYQHADIITYLPADTKRNAELFIELTNPQLVVFVKYEYWYHHLSVAAFHHIPMILVSAIFRKDQIFFKWYGKFYRRMLFLFRQIFVQDENSLQLLKAIQVNHCSIAGDTRFDRVKKIQEHFTDIDLIKDFAKDDKVIVAGSTWPDDEKILSQYAKNSSAKFIIAPHEINETHLKQIENLFPNSICYSSFQNFNQQFQTLIIDNMGMLSRLYRYADITYIGGGFNKSGIHNTLEAAVYGKPIFFGPYYKKFKEARDLIEVGGAFSFSNEEEFQIKMDHLFNDPQQLLQAGNISKKYVEQNTGATKKIIQFIQEKRLLTK